jgi:hypothetical protein
MKFDIKQMKKQYDGKPVKDCIDLVKKFNAEMIQRGEELVSLLYYLEKTKRFREDPTYKKLDFKVFVWEACHISYNRYRELAFAYNWFPEESRELGPTTIQTARTKVGVSKLPQVLSEIKATTSKIKNPEKKREAVNRVIEKHAPKPTTTATTDTKAYWKQKCAGLEKRLQAVSEENKALKKENADLRAQLDRQKAPVEAFLKVREVVQPVVQ